MNCDCNNLIILEHESYYNGKYVEFKIKQQCTSCGKIWIWGNE